MKRIKLTKGKYALVSDADYSKLDQFNWFAEKHGKTYYARRHENIGGKRRPVLMHREILGLEFGTKVKGEHRDGNGLNNQRRNLRIATNGQNLQNRGRQHNNKSGYKGVCWHKQHRSWQAQIKANGKVIYLGRFKSIKQAAKAYDTAARKHFGKFAQTNFA